MKHRYPRRLLPKRKFSLIPEECFITEMKEFFLLRRIKKDDSKQDFRDKLKSQFIPSTFGKGISVVLLSIYRKEDIGWCCRKPYGKKMKYECKWEDNNRKTIFPKNKHLQFDKGASFGGYKISEVYEYQADYPISKNENGTVRTRPDLVKLKVIHEPVCINFWHCEIMLYGVNGDDMNTYNFSNSKAEKVGNIILDDLAEMAHSCEETKSFYLNRKFYKNNRV